MTRRYRVRSRRWSWGPFTAYAYHDHPTVPRRSPFYAGVRVGRFGVETHISSDSPLRPFSGDPQ